MNSMRLKTEYSGAKVKKRVRLDYPCLSAQSLAQLGMEDSLRFGRYPHRNAVLGRESTLEELVFLSEPGSAF